MEAVPGLGSQPVTPPLPIGLGVVAHGYGIAAVGSDSGTGGNGVAGSLIEGDSVEIGRVVGFLIVVDGLTIFLVGLRGIAGDFRLSRHLSL